VPLSLFGVAYVGAVDVFGLRFSMDSFRFKVMVANCVANGVLSPLSSLSRRLILKLRSSGTWRYVV
jgi:hypothetical protein